MHFCRDVDWGTAPQWATVIVAAIVGGVSIWGIITARGSYKSSVKDKHEAQARLVYPRLVSVDFVDKGTPIMNIGEGGSLQGSGHSPMLDDNNEPVKTTQEERVYFCLGVVNNSKELVGDIRLHVVDRATGKDHESAWTWTDVVDPETSYEYSVILVNKEWLDRSYSLTSKVTFRDSGGTYWSRVGSDPIVEIEKPPWPGT